MLSAARVHLRQPPRSPRSDETREARIARYGAPYSWPAQPSMWMSNNVKTKATRVSTMFAINARLAPPRVANSGDDHVRSTC
jgi:hypothetical protein